MFTRTINCYIKPEKKQEFFDVLRHEVYPFYQKQNGFIDLVAMISSENPEHAYVMAVWKDKSLAEQFYFNNAPLVETLKPFVKKQEVEHFFIDFSTAFATATGKAA